MVTITFEDGDASKVRGALEMKANDTLALANRARDRHDKPSHIKFCRRMACEFARLQLHVEDAIKDAHA